MHRPRRAIPTTCLLLLLSLGAGACGDDGPQEGLTAGGGAAATLDAGRFLPLRTEGQRILDAEGRQVILRGVQHHALQDVNYKGREVLPADYPLMASWGFTTLRMAISWSRVEPTRGAYDSGYLAQIKAAMDLAHGAGLTVILEWHQDLWGRCAIAGSSPYAMNANGAPGWACPAGYKAGTPADSSALFDELWTNKGGLLDAFIAAWLAVVKAVGGHPALLGYELFNEPNGSDASPDFEKNKYFPALGKVVPAMRAGGAKGLLFLGSPVMRNETFNMYTEPLDTLGKDLVFAPHLYSGWWLMYLFKRRVDPEHKAKDFKNAVAQAAQLRLPLWNGEWGVNLYLDGATADLETHMALEERHRIGSSYWAFQRAVKGQGDDSISGGQALLDAQRQVRREVLDRLSRPYPIQIPGQLTGLSYTSSAAAPGQRLLSLKLTLSKVGQAPLVLYAPARQLGRSLCLEVDGPGGWSHDHHPRTERVLVRFAAAGDYTVRLKPCP